MLREAVIELHVAECFFASRNLSEDFLATKKEERNKLQELDFLKLSPEERFYTFLQLSERLQKFPVSKKRLENGNFLINIKRV